MDEAPALLSLARERIGEGRPTAALEAIIAALRLTGGEAAVLQTLDRARQMHQSGAAPQGAADQLAALFAQCVLAESSRAAGPAEKNGDTIVPDVSYSRGFEEALNGAAPQSSAGAFQESNHDASPMEDDSESRQNGRVPILAEEGRLQVVRDAYADGSSFLCLRCKGVFKVSRMDEHMTIWCPGLPGTSEPG
ncbi:hypothetical protein KFL_004950090 [Klebsormidium nitens]|uniref:C2HC zinc finger plants domain-containing protein n=1 Tax=Klebsormidium nitens TaxID=105231 RepID=A0A1Y1IE35_KLENI|nr:hypothetical protein KFL_004950090 [Klebsormidium nitens]|eukprot:GAQ89190.1 hypothetical protein KFL_004950090 [Klebsormidium nitens]